MSALYWYIALTGVGILNDEKKSKIVDTSWNLSATKFIYYRDSLIAVEPYGVFGHFWTYNTTWILILHDLMRISALLDNLLIFTHETWTCCCMEHLKRHMYFSDFSSHVTNWSYTVNDWATLRFSIILNLSLHDTLIQLVSILKQYQACLLSINMCPVRAVWFNMYLNLTTNTDIFAILVQNHCHCT